MNDPETPHPVPLSPEELKRQQARSKALGFLLAALAVLFFIVTLAKLGSNVFNRSL